LLWLAPKANHQWRNHIINPHSNPQTQNQTHSCNIKSKTHGNHQPTDSCSNTPMPENLQKHHKCKESNTNLQTHTHKSNTNEATNPKSNNPRLPASNKKPQIYYPQPLQAGNKSYKTMPATHTTPATSTSYNSSQTHGATTTTKSTTHIHHRQNPQPITTNSSQR
jgi:hypothetical protein